MKDKNVLQDEQRYTKEGKKQPDRGLILRKWLQQRGKSFSRRKWLLILLVLIFPGGKWLSYCWENMEIKYLEREKESKTETQTEAEIEMEIKVKRNTETQTEVQMKAKVKRNTETQTKAETESKTKTEMERAKQRAGQGKVLREVVAELFFAWMGRDDEGNVLEFGEDIYWMDIGDKAHPFYGKCPKNWKAGGRISSMLVNEKGELLELVYEGADKSKEFWKFYNEGDELVVEVVER